LILLLNKCIILRKTYKYKISNNFIEKLYFYSSKFEFHSFLLSNKFKSDRYSKYQNLIALGIYDSIESNNNSMTKMQIFLDKNSDWTFGFLSYDLKNELEDLDSKNIDDFDFPNIYFVVPETVLIISDSNLIVKSFLKKEEVDTMISEVKNLVNYSINKNKIKLNSRESKKDYKEKIRKIKNHIQRGDIYEMNYCHEFYSRGVEICPEKIFIDLNKTSKAPFSIFSKIGSKYLMCSSPERFLKKIGDKLITQPIKGTCKRGENFDEDQSLLKKFHESKKDRIENIMITDLVRNDLSKIAKKSTVNVEELFKVYTFERVHQMVTTVSAFIKNGIGFSDIIESTFPMGSMTGAPKIKSMQLIDKYETKKRSLFSSAFGYIEPGGDFDFNVVIRSIIYDNAQKYISVMVGGAITIESDAEEEYQETLIKAQAMIDVLKDD
tara:strand:+ start:46314 stop:47624 length:1311 start_codon:yes stop_codon:yes gene_type:complete